MKRYPFEYHLYLFHSFVFIVFIANSFVRSDLINYIIGLLALVMLIISYPRATKLFQILSGAFIVMALSLYFNAGESLIDLPSLLTSNLSLLSLLAMLPWMNSVVRSGRFDLTLSKLMKKNITDLGKLYMRSAGITLILASFLNLSAITISQEVLKESLPTINKKMRNSIISISTLRGFSLALLWSPLEILLAVTIFETGVSYVKLLPWLLFIAVIIFMIDSFWGRFYYRKYSYVNTVVDDSVKINMKELRNKVVHLIIALSVFLMLVILLGNLFELDFILTVTLLIFPFSFAWSIIMKRKRRFLLIGWKSWKEKTNKMQNFIILFISLSLFSNSINNTSFLEYIQQPVTSLSEYPLIVFFLIQIIFICMSMLGIHPIATIGILSSLLGELLIIYNPLSIAIVMITSSIATLTVGTYGLVVTLTAINLEMNPYKITIKNLIYSLLFGGVGSLIALGLL